MKKLKIFPKMFIQIFSVLGIIIILVHSLVFFIFPKTYLETRKEKIHNIADEISGNMNGKEIKYIEQTLELYSKSSEIKAFIKEMMSFFACRVLSGILCDVGTFALMVKVLNINDIIAKIVTQIMVVILNYVLSKLVIFKKKSEK